MKSRLLVPRRPKWSKEMTPRQLERNERDAFLEWRRSLAECVPSSISCYESACVLRPGP